MADDSTALTPVPRQRHGAVRGFLRRVSGAERREMGRAIAVERARVHQLEAELRTTRAELADVRDANAIERAEVFNLHPSIDDLKGSHLEVGPSGGVTFVLDQSPLYRQDVKRDEYGNPVSRTVYVERRGALPWQTRGAARTRGADDRIVALRDDVDPEKAKTAPGHTGTPWSGGRPATEHRSDMQPLQALGFSTEIGELRRAAKHPVIDEAVSTFVDLLVGGSWYVSVPEVDEDLIEFLGFDFDETKRHAAWVNANLWHNESVRMADAIREMCFGPMVDGHSVHAFGIDSSVTGNDRHLVALEYREPAATEEWLYDGARLLGFTQRGVPGPTGGADVDTAVVDIRQCVHVVNKALGNNPEGLSDVRAAWPWSKGAGEFWQTIMQHRRRFGYGFPVFRTTTDASVTKSTADSIASARKFFAHPQAYMQLPKNVTLELMQMQPDTAGVDIMRYCDQQMRRALGAQWLDLGNNGVGSFSLADSIGQMFMRRVASKIEQVRQGMSQLVRALVDAKFGPSPGRIYPELRVDGVLQRSPDEILRTWRENQVIELNPGYSRDQHNQRRKQLGIPPIDETDPDVGDDPETPARGEVPPGQHEQADKVDDANTEVPDAEVGSDDADSGADSRRARHKGACNTGCGCGTARASKARVAVIGRDGLEFYSHRTLTAGEEHVAWRSVSDSIDDTQAATVSALVAVGVDYRNAYVELVRPLIDESDREGIAVLALDWLKPFVDVMRERLQVYAAEVEADMLAEIASATGTGDWDAVEQINANAVGIDAVIESEALEAGLTVFESFTKTLRQLAMTAAKGGPLQPLLTAKPNERYVGLQIVEAITTTMNEQREYVALTQGPEVAAERYSAVMDGDTCGEVGDGTGRCADMDGKSFVPGSAASEKAKCPNPKCDGAKATSRSNPCRCLMVYEFRV